MSRTASSRGGVAVGDLSTLDPLRMGAVVYLRMWCDGPTGRAQVAQDFETVLGGTDARHAVAALDGVCAVCARAGRRPILRHGVSCRCLGADESWFANLVEAASAGADEDALMIAGHLVQPSSAPGLVGLAGTLGLAIRQVAERSVPIPPQTRAATVTLH